MNKHLRTIAKKIDISGKGIHSGIINTFTILPSNVYGIYIQIKNKNYQICSKHYDFSKKTSYIKIKNIIFFCPEHFFASLYLLKINSLILKINNNIELPTSPLEDTYYNMLKNNILENYNIISVCKNIDYNINLIEGKRFYNVFYSNDAFIQVEINFQDIKSKANNTIKKVIYYSELINNEILISKLSSTRTWIYKQDLEYLQDHNLCLGIDKTNCIVIDSYAFKDENILNECVMHKIYDLLGDLFLYDNLEKLSIIARNPNHRMNKKILSMLVN